MQVKTIQLGYLTPFTQWVSHVILHVQKIHQNTYTLKLILHKIAQVMRRVLQTPGPWHLEISGPADESGYW